MPDLPTLTVTQAQADRMLAVFGSTTAYKAWLREAITSVVISSDLDTLQQDQASARDAKVAALRAELGS